MLYLIENAFAKTIINLPFTDIQSAQKQFNDEEQTIIANNVCYQAIITSKNCLHTILSKSASLEEEKHTLRLPGQVTSNVELLEYLNKQAEKAQGENRQKFSVLLQAKQANKEKLEKAQKEIDSILYGVKRLCTKYEYYYNPLHFGFYDIETQVTLYINARLADCLQDTNEFVSDTKTALYEAMQKGLPIAKVEKAGYRALSRYIYDFKKTDVHYCLDDENQTISINAMMKAMEINGQGNLKLRKAFNDCFKYLSKPERVTALCTGYGYTPEYIASILNVSLSTTYTYWKKAKGKLARLLPQEALSCNIKPIALYEARKELEAIQEEQAQARKEADKKRNASPERKAYKAQKAKERRAREKARKEAEKAQA